MSPTLDPITVPPAVPIIIPMEDELVHTETRPFCDDPTCPCHADPELISAVQDAYHNGLLTATEVTSVIAGRTL